MLTTITIVNTGILPSAGKCMEAASLGGVQGCSARGRRELASVSKSIASAAKSEELSKYAGWNID
jgi:hypothetical protein